MSSVDKLLTIGWDWKIEREMDAKANTKCTLLSHLPPLVITAYLPLTICIHGQQTSQALPRLKLICGSLVLKTRIVRLGLVGKASIGRLSLVPLGHVATTIIVVRHSCLFPFLIAIATRKRLIGGV